MFQLIISEFNASAEIQQEEEDKKRVSFSPGPPVLEHARWFADANGNLTYNSMVVAHKKLGITAGVDFKARAILKAVDGSCSCPLRSMLAFKNPARTGLWDEDGNFDESRFDKLLRISRSTNGRNEKVIRKKDMLHLMLSPQDNGVLSWVFYVVPVFWTWVTQGSLDELFLYFADQELPNGERVFSPDKLHQFYTNPNLSVLQRLYEQA